MVLNTFFAFHIEIGRYFLCCLQGSVIRLQRDAGSINQPITLVIVVFYR